MTYTEEQYNKDMLKLEIAKLQNDIKLKESKLKELENQNKPKQSIGFSLN